MMSSNSPSSLGVLLGTAFCATVAYLSFKWIYRLYFHPLAAFPGPKLAAISHFYEGYYDVVEQGRYIFQIEKMHKKYGPIVRIGPNEVHILDAEYYEKFYSQTNNKVDKYQWFYTMLGNPMATFPTISADVHKLRRNSLAPFFSIAAISKIEPNIRAVVDRLANRMSACAEKDTVIPLFYSYRCMTVDMISEYAFGKQLGLLDREDWGESFYSAWRALWELSGLVRQFPMIMDIFDAMPRWLLAKTNPGALEVLDMKDATDALTKEVLETDPKTYGEKPFPTVMWEVSNSPILPPEEKTFRRLATDANSILAAGFETTANVLTLTTYLILENAEIHERLKKELADAIPNENEIPSWQTLEKLPLLSSCVKEGLRLAVGAFSRLPRLNPKEAVQYKQWTIPPGVAIGMSNLFISMSAEIFPNPETFDPDRWDIPNSATRRRLEHYLHPFGKGSRMCVAQNMAYAETYIALATILRRFPKLRNFETSKRDMEYVHDYFAGMARHETGGLKVKVG